MTMVLPESLALAQLPTPIQPLDRLTDYLGSRTRLWIKRDDLTGSATTGNKIRKLEFSLAEARQQGADVIITCGGVQSNHARTTALLGAQLGIKVHLLLRGEAAELTSKGNHMLDLLAGAAISCYPSSTYVANFQQLVQDLCDDYRQRGMTPYFITTGASDATGLWGYVKASLEIKSQLESMALQMDDVVTACGSGGTLAGLAAGHHLLGMKSRVWGINVCDTASYFEHKARMDIQHWQEKYAVPVAPEEIAFELIDGYVGRGYAKADAPVYDAIKLLASLEGIVLDPIYTGKAFYGLLTELHEGRFGQAENLLFIHTGGIFGLMADQDIHHYL